MIRVLSRGVLCTSLVTFSFAMVPACLGLPAKVQSDQKTNAKSKESNRTATDFQFEVVSVRPTDPQKNGGYMGASTTPNGYRATLSLSELIKFAYSSGDLDLGFHSDPTNVVNLPSWEGGYGGHYQINARVAENDVPAWQAQGKGQELLRSGLRALLKDRFRLVLHEQPLTIPVYNLVVSRKGIRLKPSIPGSVLPLGYKFPDGGVSSLFSRDPTQPARFYNATIADLMWVMRGNPYMDHPIHDGTELAGHYDFSLYHLPMNAADGDIASYYALGALGLELKPGKGTGLNLVIDHIEKPSPN